MMKAYTIVKEEIEALFWRAGSDPPYIRGGGAVYCRLCGLQKNWPAAGDYPRGGLADGLFREAGRDLYQLPC